MKTVRKLNIKDWSGYFFKEMVNILEIQPEYFMINDFGGCKDGLTVFNLCYCQENNVPHIFFNNIECIFRKSGVFSYLIFCESDKNKKMPENYGNIVGKLKKEILPFEDDECFIMGSDFMRFRLKTDDNLVYNTKINIPVCVISLSCTVKRDDIYDPQFRLQGYIYDFPSSS